MKFRLSGKTTADKLTNWSFASTVGLRLRRTRISFYLHCVVECLSEIGWNTPGALHWGRRREQMKPFNRHLCCSQTVVMSAPTEVAPYQQPGAESAGAQMSPSWCSPPSRSPSSSCTRQTLKGDKSHVTGPVHGAAASSRPPAQTFPQVLGAAVSQDGDEGLLIGAKLLLPGLEEDLQEQMNYTFDLVAPLRTSKVILQRVNWERKSRKHKARQHVAQCLALVRRRQPELRVKLLSGGGTTFLWRHLNITTTWVQHDSSFDLWFAHMQCIMTIWAER